MEKVITILLIDDDAFIRMLVKDIFWVHGRGKYEVYETENIGEAEKFLEEKKPDLIFLDLMFPEDGLGMTSSLSFLKKIKTNPKTKDIKVIVFSGYPEFKKEHLKELGAEEFLIKGEQLPKELFEITEKIIKRNKRK